MIKANTTGRKVTPRTAKKWRALVDSQLDNAVPRGHAFAFFRVGEDLCWKCGKTKKEHERS